MDRSRIDWPSFGASVAFIVVVCIPLAFAPEVAGKQLEVLYNFIANQFGIL